MVHITAVSFFCMHVMTHNWSATKQHLHPQSVGDKPLFSFVKGHDSTMWDIVWISPQGHRSVSVSRHFLLQAPQCPCSVRKQFSRDHCCRGRSKPGCHTVGSHTTGVGEIDHLSRLPVMLYPLAFDVNWLQI